MIIERWLSSFLHETFCGCSLESPGCSLQSPEREAILISTHNIGFYEEMSKIISSLSSNKHFICSFAYIFI